MDTTIGMEAAITPKRGDVKPIHTFSPERRGIDEDTVADLVNALTRDGCFLHPIVVRAEAQTIRLAAALKKLNGGKPVAAASDSGEAAETGNLVPGLAPASGAGVASIGAPAISGRAHDCAG
jgi:hypothetical protein